MYENYENYTPESFNENFGMEGMDELSTFDPASPFARNVRASSEFQNRTKDKLKDAVITLRIQNRTSVVRTVELFNTIKHITKVPNTAIYGSVIKPLSISTIASFLTTLMRQNNAALIAGKINAGNVSTDPLAGVAFWDDLTGNLVYNYGANREFNYNTQDYTVQGLDVRSSLTLDTLGPIPNDQMLVSCAQMPYRQLVDNLGAMVLSIRQWKLQTSSENQIKQAFRPYLYGDLGVVTNDSFEPSEFFNPENQQTKLINMTRQMYVNKNTAVYIDVEPYEDMQLTLNVSAFRDNGLGWLGGK
jgi:hypothetical protein